jgi:hypothetical protein
MSRIDTAEAGGERPLTRDEAALVLRRLAAGVHEQDPEAAAARLLERVAATRAELRDALVLEGALALVREVRLWP